jgi:hypothetical protein
VALHGAAHPEHLVVEAHREAVLGEIEQASRERPVQEASRRFAIEGLDAEAFVERRKADAVLRGGLPAAPRRHHQSIVEYMGMWNAGGPGVTFGQRQPGCAVDQPIGRDPLAALEGGRVEPAEHPRERRVAVESGRRGHHVLEAQADHPRVPVGAVHR